MKWLPIASEKASRLRGLDLVRIAGERADQRAQVLHPPVVDAAQAGGDGLVAARPVADREVDREQVARERQHPGAPTLARGSPPSRSTRSSTSSRAPALPRVEHLVEQRAAVLEVPVEAAAGDAERLRQRLDPDRVRARRRRGRASPPRSSCSGGCGSGPPSRPVSRPVGLTRPEGRGYAHPYRTVRMKTTPMRLPPLRAHVPPLAHPRARGRLPARGCLGAADARRPDDLPRLVGCSHRRRHAQLVAAGPRALGPALAARPLLGWDRADAGLGVRVPTLRDRLPATCATPRRGPATRRFTSLYLTDDEWAAEIRQRGPCRRGRPPRLGR